MAMKGPLAPWAPGMALRLETLGYTPRMVHVHLQFAGTFSRSLLRHGVTAGDVSPELIEQFVTGLRTKNTSWRPTSKRLSWLVEYLRDVGVIGPVVVPEPRTAQQVLLQRYSQYLVDGQLDCDVLSNNPIFRLTPFFEQMGPTNQPGAARSSGGSANGGMSGTSSLRGPRRS
jgi:hypothetical protein